MSATENRFPWRSLMKLGLRDLRLAPEQFWRSTLRELVCDTGSPPVHGLRQSFSELMAQWPDDNHDT